MSRNDIELNGFGCLIVVLGLVFAAYIGLWVCAIGGIVQVVEAVESEPVESLGIAIGIVRFLATSIVFWLTFIVSMALAAIFGSK